MGNNSINVRQMIREFALAFKRPVNSEPVMLSVSDRLLLGKLLLEETLEYCTKGLGLELVMADYDPGASDGDTVFDASGIDRLKLQLDEGRTMNLKEVIDGLADVQVVAHFNAHWHGFNLDYATKVVHESNMSKLDDEGQPIINECLTLQTHDDHICNLEPCALLDESKPRGKILKSKNFFEPDFTEVINFGNPPYNPGDNVGISEER